MQKNEYLYYAFISYRHIDQKWAKWLKHKLQAYRLPTRTSKQHQNLPKRLSPIFYDVNLLPGGVNEQIKEELNGNSFYKRLVPADEHALWNAAHRCIETRESTSTELKIRSADGEVLSVIVDADYVDDELGDVRCILSMRKK